MQNVKVSIWNRVTPLWRELFFQVILVVTVFIFYISGRGHHNSVPEIHFYDVLFFLNYVAAAMMINYILLPRLLYAKKYVRFVLGLVLVIAWVIVAEEFILEKIFFPTTRGSKFPGVFFNLVGALPTMAILTGAKFGYDALTQRRVLEELKRAASESELQFLKTQINPHFLFNNLNNLYAHSLEKSEKTPEIILELSGVLRYMLYECREKYVPLEKEVEQLENFVNLSRFQIEDRGEINFHVGDVASGYRVAPLILSVFIENAVKHSASSLSENIRIDIHLNVDPKGRLIFSCENTYSDVSNTEELSAGIGLANVQKRLDLLYPKAHRLIVTPSAEVYRVELILDLNKAE